MTLALKCYNTIAISIDEIIILFVKDLNFSKLEIAYDLRGYKNNSQKHQRAYKH